MNNISYIKTKQFPCVDFNLSFIYDFNEKDLGIFNLLQFMFFEGIEGCPTENELEKESRLLYHPRISCNCRVEGNKIYFSFNFVFIKPEYLDRKNKDDLFYKNLDFFYRIAFKHVPVEQETFNENIKILIQNIQNHKKDLFQSLLTTSVTELNINLADLSYFLDEKKYQTLPLEEFTKIRQKLSESKFLLSVAGDLSLKQKRYINQLFHLDNFKIEKIKYNKYRLQKVKKIVTKFDSPQSAVCLVYSLPKPKNVEDDFLNIFIEQTIFNRSGSMVNRIIREELNLCYYVGAQYTLSQFYFVSAQLNKKNANKFINEIKNILESKVYELSETELEKAKISFLAAYQFIKDSPTSMNRFNTFYKLRKEKKPDYEKIISEFTLEKLFGRIKMLTLRLIHIREGDQDNEKNS